MIDVVHEVNCEPGAVKELFATTLLDLGFPGLMRDASGHTIFGKRIIVWINHKAEVVDQNHKEFIARRNWKIDKEIYSSKDLFVRS